MSESIHKSHNVSKFMYHFVCLEKQSTELMIVVPKEVEESYTNIAVGFKTKSNTLSYENGFGGQKAREEERKTGKTTVMSRRIEGTV